MIDPLNFGELGKVFEQIKDQAKSLEEETEKTILTAKSGGGMVSVSMNGKGEVVDIQIDDSLMEDKESLQILLMSAFNDAAKMVEENKKRLALGLIGKMPPFGTR